MANTIFFVGVQRYGNYFRARVRLVDGSHRVSRQRFPAMGEALNYGNRWAKRYRRWA